MLDDLFRALLGVPGVLVTVASQGSRPAKLDTSIGVSGPHGFVGRVTRFVMRVPGVHRFPASRFVTIGRNVPRAEAGWHEDGVISVFPQ